MKFINLQHNDLTGEFPRFLGSSVESIKLNHNGFTGKLPTNLGIRLTKLEELHVNHNNLTGLVPVEIDESDIDFVYGNNTEDKVRYIDRENVTLELEEEVVESKVKKGIKVEVRYRGGARYYLGIISRVRLNGTVDIDYDDGEREFGVKPELIKGNGHSEGKKLEIGQLCKVAFKISKRSKFEVDMKVEARYKGKTKYYTGVIKRIRSNGIVDITYDDGEKEFGVKPELVRKVKVNLQTTDETNRSDGTDEPEERKLEVDMKVEARYKGKVKYYAGKISKVCDNGTVDIQYDDGEKELGVKPELVRERVELITTTILRSGKISAINSNGTVNVDFDDNKNNKKSEVERRLVAPLREEAIEEDMKNVQDCWLGMGGGLEDLHNEGGDKDLKKWKGVGTHRDTKRVDSIGKNANRAP